MKKRYRLLVLSDIGAPESRGGYSCGRDSYIDPTNVWEIPMSESKLPRGWNEAKIRRVLAHYEGQTEEVAPVEDESGGQPSEMVMSIPHELIAKRNR